MKLLRKHFKRVALLLSVAVLVQGCNVYTYKKTDIDEAVKTESKKFKLWTDNNKKYYFDKLQTEKGQIVGYTHSDSKTAKQLKDQIILVDDFNQVKILLKDDQINAVYVYKNTSPIVQFISVVVPSAFVFAIINYL